MKKFKGIIKAAVPSVCMIGLQLIVMLLINIIINIAAAVIIRVNPSLYSKFALLKLDSIYLFGYELVAVFFFAALYFSKHSAHSKSFGGKLSLPAIPGIALLFAGAEMVTSCVLVLLYYVIPETMADYSEKMAATIGDLSPITIASAIILAPIAEEFIFRGITMELSLKLTKRFWVANVIQAVFFGIVHLNLIQGVYAFLLGLLLGVIRRRYDSLIASILGHMMFNFAGSILVGVVFPGDTADSLVYIAMVAGISTIGVLAGLFIIAKDNRSREGCAEFKEMHETIYRLANEPVRIEN